MRVTVRMDAASAIDAKRCRQRVFAEVLPPKHQVAPIGARPKIRCLWPRTALNSDRERRLFELVPNAIPSRAVRFLRRSHHSELF
jgi:hypothetical protein